MAKSSVQKRKKIVNRIEPSAQLFFAEYEDYAKMFKQCGWLVFCRKLQGHDSNVTLEFAEGFDGKTKKIQDMTMEVTEDSISATIGLPQSGQ